ncbi:MAG: H/ACA ribonucleoprotein complex subunit GAR1/NAF1 [Thermoplasmataceae archaeon]
MNEECTIVNHKSNEILITGSKNFSINSKIFDSKGVKLGKVIRVLGNVDKPYALAVLERPLQEESMKTVFLR